MKAMVKNNKKLKLLVYILLFIFIDIQKKIWLYCSIQSSFLKKIIRKNLLKYTISISEGAIIHNSVKFPHPQNIVIGRGVIIDKNCVIYQGVTLGVNNGLKEINESDIYLYYPHVKQGTVIYSNAVVSGGIEVGEESIIGANAFLNTTVPPFSVIKSLSSINRKE